ncbi:MAG TPA: hypothetical protein VM734_22325 [Kofleriaceae bacterium]|nr:hypothetical protein [Kofleriaceae bacterium]
MVLVFAALVAACGGEPSTPADVDGAPPLDGPPLPHAGLPDGFTRRASGGYELRSASGETLVLDGEREAMRSLAYSLRETEAPPQPR